ncbi:MAG: hypothetical protein AAF962_26165 [Actinomycetota bacterium]
MGTFIRLLLFGWAFVIVVMAAWLGLLDPSPEPGTAGTAPSGDATASTTTDATPDERSPASGVCRPHRLDGVDFYDRTPVLRPEAETAIVAFIVELRDAGCVADAVGSFCPAPEAAAVLHGHAEDDTLTTSEEYRLSFERALAVATVLMANDVTVGSIAGTGAGGPAVAAGGLGPVDPGTGAGGEVRADVEVGAEPSATVEPGSATAVADPGSDPGAPLTPSVDIGLRCPTVRGP